MSFPPQRSYRWLFWWLAALGLVLDLGSKYAMFSWHYHENLVPLIEAQKTIQPHDLLGKIEIVPGVFSLEAAFTFGPGTGDSSPNFVPHVNNGALFGIGGGGNVFFAVVSFLAAAAIIFWSTRPSAALHGYLCFALGLILAGTLGNLYDRLVFNGVRDFLHWYKWVDWPVFNIADCCLVLGAGLLLAEAVFARPEKKTSFQPTHPSAHAAVNEMSSVP